MDIINAKIYLLQHNILPKDKKFKIRLLLWNGEHNHQYKNIDSICRQLCTFKNSADNIFRYSAEINVLITEINFILI